MESASKQAIVQAEETATSTTEDIVYLQDFPTKLISMLRLCANFTFGMEIHTSPPPSSPSRASDVTLIQIHITLTTSRILYLVLHHKGGSVIPSNITHGFSPSL